jgi:hypothetical protein
VFAVHRYQRNHDSETDQIDKDSKENYQYGRALFHESKQHGRGGAQWTENE